jgi:segregation and condensation protein B
MNESFIKNVVEAAMLAAGRPLQVAELAELFDETNRPAAAAIRAALASLEEDYTGRGIEVKETATGFRIQVRRDLANEVSRLWPERPPKYSRALLETLALIAYRQPITRAEIEAVRGVAVNPNIVKTLLERNWVRVVGTRDVPGRPELLGTTKDFLDYFGLRGLEDLPPLAELKAMGDVNLQLDLAKDVAVADAAATGADAASVAEGESDPAAVAAAPRAEGDAGEVMDSAVEELLASESGEGEASGPAARAAESFVAEIDSDDADGSGSDDDSSDEDELSAADPQGAGELVASPPNPYDD